HSLDQLLLSFHASDQSVGLGLYEHNNTYVTLRKQFEDILRWTKDSKIIVEVCTVVSRANAKNIVALGQWLFSLRSDIFWRLDEYYANGAQGPLRESLELRKEEFSELLAEIEKSLPDHWHSRQIRSSKKEGRHEAPDIMITPQGNFVTSSNYEY